MTDGAGGPGSAERVAVCEHAQSQWLRSRALTAGGSTWHDDAGLRWVWNPATLEGSLLFPRELPEDAVRTGMERLDDRRAASVGAWLSWETDPALLAAHGFERGWSPWWMWADLPLVPRAPDPRVHIDQVVPAAYLDAPQRAWHAVAEVGGERAGGAWLHRVGDVAGIFDMSVDPRRERRGLGSALLALLCHVGHQDGAATAVLNATPAGAELYSRRGFMRVGDGITWWWHRAS